MIHMQVSTVVIMDWEYLKKCLLQDATSWRSKQGKLIQNTADITAFVSCNTVPVLRYRDAMPLHDVGRVD